MLQRLKKLLKNLTIYGVGDVATSIVSFLLLPVYVRFLSPSDYGVIGLLLSAEVVTKIIFRWGVDAAFMRLYYDCTDHRSRQQLASTLFFFLLAVDGSLLGVGLAVAPWLSLHLFGEPGHSLVLSLVLLNTFIIGFYFIPFHVLRIEEKAPQFIALTVSRSVATLLLRLVLVVFGGMGVLGVVLADVSVNVVFAGVLARRFVPLIRPMFSTDVLRASLAFGLPRLPHGLAHQVVAVADRYLLSLFGTLRDVGLYSIGASFGLALKLFLSAFEYAWAPFYFATMKEPDAKRTFSLVTTYGLAILVLLAAGLSATARDLVRLMTTSEFHEAARVIPWIAVGVVLQGAYLLTSIGLNITKQTQYYPVATGLAALTSVTANLVLIPRFGTLGAAWSAAAAYAVLAASSMAFSQRVYPMAYEWTRIARSVGAGVVAYLAARVAIPEGVPALAGLLGRGVMVLAVYPTLLLATGFFAARELDVARRLARRLQSPRSAEPTADTAELGGEIVGTTLPGATESSRDAEGRQAARWIE